MPTGEDVEAVVFPQDPEAVIYDALADTVSTGILKWIRITRIPGTDVSVRSAPRPEVFWDAEATDALKGVAHHVITKLQSQGYQIINAAGDERAEH
jgi:hypothetical protein